MSESAGSLAGTPNSWSIIVYFIITPKTEVFVIRCVFSRTTGYRSLAFTECVPPEHTVCTCFMAQWEPIQPVRLYYKSCF